MHPLFEFLTQSFFFTGATDADAQRFLEHHRRPDTALHCAAVAQEAQRLAEMAGIDRQQAEQAGWLHDISAVIPGCGHKEARRLAEMEEIELQVEQAGRQHEISEVAPVHGHLAAARALGLEILPEEASAPVLIHQKLSAVMAEQVFGVRERQVLDAISCHTTLRAHSTRLDKVLFVADKLAWDQPGEAPFAKDMRASLKISLERAVWVYLDYLWQRRQTLPAIHPWMAAAYRELSTL